MKKLILVVGGLVALAVPLIASAGAPYDRATGGGQILIDQKPGNGLGAGDTIAFTSQNTGTSSNAAKGEVQYVDRTGGIGKDAVRQHGDVFCMAVMGAMAEIGYRDKGTTGGDVDQLYVIDGGEPNQGNDMIFVDENPETPCEFEDDSDDDGEVALARGNVQIYNAP